MLPFGQSLFYKLLLVIKYLSFYLLCQIRIFFNQNLIFGINVPHINQCLL